MALDSTTRAVLPDQMRALLVLPMRLDPQAGQDTADLGRWWGDLGLHKDVLDLGSTSVTP